MTDGIIQEVFNPIIAILEGRSNNIKFSPNEFKLVIEGMKQELIEKIKQNKIHVRFSMDAILLKTLIGDNQE